MKTYINAQGLKTISEVIHHVMVVAKIFTPNKGFMKPQDNGEKNLGKYCANKDTKFLATRINVLTTTRRKRVRSIKAKTSYPLLILRSIGKRTGALDVRSKGTIIATIPRRLKELHKRHIFYPHMTTKFHAHLNFYTLGEE